MYAESVFTAACPEIMLLNNNTEPGEAQYSLKFFNDTDVNTHKFNSVVSSLKNTSIVYVSLGNDELNIETAIKVRILFERIGIYPIIRAVVHSELKNKLLTDKGLVNYKKQNYDIETIGSLKHQFSYNSIVNEELEFIALKHHLSWADTPEKIENATRDFNEIEYFRNSSIASAIHDMYRRHEKLNNDTATLYEHIRWNAYMRTEGYVYSGSTDASSRNDRAKMHNDLVKQKVLSDEEINKDKRMINIT